VTVQHLHRVIFVIMEQTIATLNAQVLMMRHLMLARAFYLLQQAEEFTKALHVTQMPYF
jgi:hypothetical protein